MPSTHISRKEIIKITDNLTSCLEGLWIVATMVRQKCRRTWCGGKRPMARRRQQEESPLDALFDTLQIAPVWVGPLLAGVVFSGLRWLIPWWLTSSPEAGNAPTVSIANSMHSTIAMFSQKFSSLAAGVVLLIWLAAEFVKWRDRSRLNRQTGIDSIRELTWFQFEKLLCEAFKREGYCVEHTGTDGPDGGVDIRIRNEESRKLVQCKHWKKNQVGVGVVREMLGIVTSERADEGIVVTSGTFTRDAISFAEPNTVRLIDGAQLEVMIGAVQRPPKMQQVASSEFTKKAPACPRCRSAMVIKQARRGKNAGSNFWSCSQFPRCRGSRDCR